MEELKWLFELRMAVDGRRVIAPFCSITSYCQPAYLPPMARHIITFTQDNA